MSARTLCRMYLNLFVVEHHLGLSLCTVLHYDIALTARYNHELTEIQKYWQCLKDLKDQIPLKINLEPFF